MPRTRRTRLPARLRSRTAAFWLTASAFAVTMAGTTLPTPLYVLYQRELGLSTPVATVVFAAYAVGVLAALVLFGRVSDVVGRRWTLLPALACAALSDVAFLTADSLPALLVGRVLSGLSAGVFTGTATAALLDLARGATERATVVATVANMGGLGAGPLLAGALARLAPAPLRLPFAVHLALVAAAAVALWCTPADPSPAGSRPLTLARLDVPATARDAFSRAAIAGFAGFAALGMFTAIAPMFLRRLLQAPDPALAGAVVCVVFLASAAGQSALVPRLGRTALPVGCAVLVAGMAVLVTGLATGSLLLLVVAAVLTGLGQGTGFRGGLAMVNLAAPRDRRAEVASAYFFVGYVALSLPIVGAGLAAERFGLRAAGIGFGLGVATIATLAGIASVSRARPTAQPARSR